MLEYLQVQLYVGWDVVGAVSRISPQEAKTFEKNKKHKTKDAVPKPSKNL